MSDRESHVDYDLTPPQDDNARLLLGRYRVVRLGGGRIFVADTKTHEGGAFKEAQLEEALDEMFRRHF